MDGLRSRYMLKEGSSQREDQHNLIDFFVEDNAKLCSEVMVLV
jgi:hypothetical protein